MTAQNRIALVAAAVLAFMMTAGFVNSAYYMLKGEPLYDLCCDAPPSHYAASAN